MINQIEPNTDPESRMWLTLQEFSNEHDRSLKIYLTQRDHSSLRTFVGDKMNFQPRFTGFGTFYENITQQYFQRFLLTQFKEILQKFMKNNPNPVPEQKSIWQKLFNIFR